MTEGKSKRSVRNLLLDKRFQLRYSLAVMAISAAIATVLGSFLYGSYHDLLGANRQLYVAHEELYRVHQENSQLITLNNLDQGDSIDAELQKKDQAQKSKYEAIARAIQDLARANRNVLIMLGACLGALVLFIGLVGIVATHKIAGPAYAMRRTLAAIAEGKLPSRSLRKGDELQDTWAELNHMTSALREREQQEIVKLGQLRARLSGQDAAALDGIIAHKQQRLG